MNSTSKHTQKGRLFAFKLAEVEQVEKGLVTEKQPKIVIELKYIYSHPV
ncbi:hypothetical protein ACMXYX_03720 [Neptuniibacter sp. QD72_48]